MSPPSHIRRICNMHHVWRCARHLVETHTHSQPLCLCASHCRTSSEVETFLVVLCSSPLQLVFVSVCLPRMPLEYCIRQHQRIHHPIRLFWVRKASLQDRIHAVPFPFTSEFQAPPSGDSILCTQGSEYSERSREGSKWLRSTTYRG